MSRFSNVTILCPDGVTGGPEALHQLSFELNNLGVDACIVYSERKYNFVLTARSAACDIPTDSVAMAAYQDYAPRVIGQRVFDSRSLMIFPEVNLDLAWRFAHLARNPTASWMLGVPLAAASATMNNDEQRPLFMDKVIHLYQSFYARQYLDENGAGACVPVFDYIDRKFVRPEAAIMDRSARIPRSIAYFPRKGGDLAEVFFKSASELIPGLRARPETS